ncbi:hypothetical protein HPB49_010767 [Dermacentor silvarum]|uniref:Uncharacterized protein n=1 Tax=Dermacentor silvarum TaxID=543639 RepID=A0ACB8C8V4_DERSI|nr:hypothetical protein HPB49_010767 [Dermacentor silvarum]
MRTPPNPSRATSVPAAFILRAVPFAVLAATTVGAFCVLLYFVLADHRQKRSLCCSDVARTLLSFSNLSVDPCSDFAGYACYHRKTLDEWALSTNMVKLSVVYPTLQGRLRNPAADSLRSHHRSCLVAFIEEEMTPEKAAIDVLSMFKEWAPGSRHLDLLKVLGLLFLRYDVAVVLSAGFSFNDTTQGGATGRYSLRISPTVAPRVLTFSNSEQVETRMLASIQSHLLQETPSAGKPTVTADIRGDVLNASIRLQDSVQASDDTVFEQDASLLQQQFPHLDLSSWREIIAECCASWNLKIEGLSSVRNVLNVITDGTTTHEALVTYFVVSAAISMFSEEIVRADAAGGLMSRAAFCDEAVLRAAPLWLVSSTSVLTTDEKDTVVRATYAATLDAVLSDADALFGDASDTRKARQALTEHKLLLPQDLARDYAPFVPNLSGRYVENKFALRRFLHRAHVLNAKHGVNGVSANHANDLEGTATRVGNVVIVAPGAYSMLCVQYSGGSDRPCELNAATLGVTLADLLWAALFERRDWSTALQRRLDERRSCQRRSPHASRQDGSGFGDLSLPLLSVRSAVRAAARPGWHAMSPDLVGDWKLSPSQVFFVLVFLTHACIGWPGRTEEDTDTPSLRAAPLVRRMEDFNAAFRCGPAPVFSIGRCL